MSSGLPNYPDSETLTTSVYDLAIDPANPSVVFAATGNDGVYKSTNGGENWVRAGTELKGKEVRVLALDPGRSSTLYAGVVSTGGGLYRSTNGGSAWSALDLGSSDPVTALAVHPTNARVLYVGTDRSDKPSRVYKTLDGGATWASALLPSGIASIAIHPTTPDVVWAATSSSGVFCSQDGGARYHPTQA